MTNLPNWLSILLLYLFVALVFQLIYMLDRRTKAEGLLFTQPINPKERVYAFLLAALLGVSFIVFAFFGFQKDESTVILGVASIALLAYSLGFDWPLQKIQKTYSQVFHSAIKKKKIIGIEGKTIDEVLYMASAGARFIIFEYCISPLVVTLDYTSNIYLIEAGEEGLTFGMRYSTISLILGWWSLFGPIFTIRSIIHNLHGGKDVTAFVIEWLKWQNEMLKRERAETIS
ncbi:MAG TPA: hypothetical protein VHM28_06745 [Anaerolineales bacterium]|nr:hypothetical protein [Anaerolineales bacterium]